MHSRNRRAGILMGQGQDDGRGHERSEYGCGGRLFCERQRWTLAKKYDTELPIIEQVNQILFEGKDPKKVVADLMLRDSKTENSLIPW